MGAHNGSWTEPDRRAVDFSEYPDLVVIYLGMKVKSLRGVKTLAGFGPRIKQSVDENPDGLLLHENLIFALFPPHAGMRQYWRDFESLERWARTLPHKDWWQHFLRDRGGTGFWHEAYSRNGEMEAVFIDMPHQGLSKFLPAPPARGSMFSARRRLRRAGEEDVPAPLPEEELYRAKS